MKKWLTIFGVFLVLGIFTLLVINQYDLNADKKVLENVKTTIDNDKKVDSNEANDDNKKEDSNQEENNNEDKINNNTDNKYEKPPVVEPDNKEPVDNDSKGDSDNKNEEINNPVEEKDENDLKRKEIEKAYGIKIAYGEELSDYKPKRITPLKLTDYGEIANYLNKLDIELAKYPKGFFSDFNKKGLPLTIYLIKSANGAFSGFTDYEFMNDIKLTLATDYSFEYTLHHELMHYIDCYLDIVMYPNNPYLEYEELNPSGFVYGNATDKKIYNMAYNTKGAYFISSYGATHVKEDRAEVFKFMMARAYKPIGCFEEGEIIRKKAELISQQIRKYFPSVTGIAHWDRFIK